MRSACSTPLLLLAAALGAGPALTACATRPCSRSARAAAALPTSAEGYYRVPGPIPQAETVAAHGTKAYRVWKTSLPARDSEPDLPSTKQPIRFTWYEPVGDRMDGSVLRGARRPLVLISPILGSDTDFVEGFAEEFADLGWHAAIVKRPKLEYDTARPLVQVEEGMRLSVSRQRQVLDWFLAREDVDPLRIGSFGISAGAIVNSIVAGADDRYAAHVLALGGGPLADVLIDSEESSLEKLVTKALAKEGTTRERFREDLRALLRSDPIAAAPRVDRERVMMIIARFDHAVPSRYQERLYEALGEPEATFVPLGHYSSILILPWVRSRTVEFLRGRFESSVRRAAPAPGGPQNPVDPAGGPTPPGPPPTSRR